MMFLLSGLTGCAGVIQPSPLRPASHPLLEQIAPRSALLSPVRHAPRTTTTRAVASRAVASRAVATRAVPSRAVASSAPRDDRAERSATTGRSGPSTATIRARLEALAGQRTVDDRRITDLDLVKSVYPERLAGTRRIKPLRQAGARVSGAVRAGDLLFFSGAGGSTELAIVWGVDEAGVIDARAVTRGAVRPIRVDPDDPHTRRRGGVVINTFLRRIRRGDGPTERYLAGQLLTDVRRLVD